MISSTDCQPGFPNSLAVGLFKMQRQLKQYYKISKLFPSGPSVVLGVV